MAETIRRGGLRSPGANTARRAEAERTADVGMNQMDADAARAREQAGYARGQANARPSMGRTARAEVAETEAARRGSMATEARSALQASRTAEPSDGPAAGQMSRAASPPAPTPAPRPAQRRPAAPARREMSADELNEISLNLARGVQGPPTERDAEATRNIARAMSNEDRPTMMARYAKGGFVKGGFGNGRATCSNNYAKKR